MNDFIINILTSLSIGLAAGLLSSWIISHRFRVLSRNFIAKIGFRYYLVEGNQKREIPDIPTRLMLELEYGEPEELSVFDIIVYLFIRSGENLGKLSDACEFVKLEGDAEKDTESGTKKVCSLFVIYKGKKR